MSNRKQFVQVENSQSSQFNVTSGVPQGSHLGPLLFNLFVNDVVSVFKYVRCLIYADDMKLFATLDNHTDSIKFQTDLNFFSTWCINNDLSLNVKKCKHITFHRKRRAYNARLSFFDTNLLIVEEIRDLGVLFDVKLNFVSHMDLSVSKALIMLGFLKRICYKFKNIECLKSIYFSYVRSNLEFACIIWSPNYMSHIKRIESVQKQFVLFALRHAYKRSNGNYVLPSYLYRCQLLNIQSLSSRRDLISRLFIYDILCSKVDSTYILEELNFYAPIRPLRDVIMFRVPFRRSNYSRLDPVYKLAILFNAVSSKFDFCVSRDEFKSSLRSLTDP